MKTIKPAENIYSVGIQLFKEQFHGYARYSAMEKWGRM